MIRTFAFLLKHEYSSERFFCNGDLTGDKVGIGNRRSPHNRAAPGHFDVDP